MTASIPAPTADGATPGPPVAAIVTQASAALAVSMGIGRFVYTPILPLMHAQAGLSAEYGSTLATANYLGYLVGAVVGIAVPALTRSLLVLRLGLIAVVVTLVGMGSTENQAAWFGLRFVAGVASALVFVIAATVMFSRLRGHFQHLVGWCFGGIGVGIALSGATVVLIRAESTWRAGWWASGALAVVLSAIAWPLRTDTTDLPARTAQDIERPRSHRWFVALFTSYFLEGIGYIIAGTFLVAAINQNSPGWAGTGAWVLVGLAAVPASAVWARLAHRWSRPTLLFSALAIQSVGIALPALLGGVGPALISAALLGATFLPVASMVLAIGAHLQFPRAVALLTSGYGIGQVIGPLISTPLLHNGYHVALLVGAAVVFAAAVAAAVLRLRFPDRVGAMVEPSRLRRPDGSVVAGGRS